MNDGVQLVLRGDFQASVFVPERTGGPIDFFSPMDNTRIATLVAAYGGIFIRGLRACTDAIVFPPDGVERVGCVRSFRQRG